MSLEARAGMVMTGTPEQVSSVVLDVRGLWFASEQNVVKAVLAGRPGVLEAEVNPVAQTATVVFDGAGGCRRYQAGTVCAPERCENNKYTPESTCGAAGTCVAPDAISCVPYVSYTGQPH